MAKPNEIEIINKALSLIGMGRITSLDDNLPQAKVAKATYTISLNSVLAAGVFSFSVARRKLALLDEEPSFIENNMSEVYSEPVDCIRLLDVFPASARYKLENGKIYSDSAELYARYVKSEENTNLYFPAFTEAFCMKLAADMCYALTNGSTQGEKLLGLYENTYLPRAKSADSSQSEAQEQIADEWLLAKYGA